MEQLIQSILFPITSKHQQCRNLFYSGDFGYIDRNAKTLSLGKNSFVDFTTYLNGCSYQKWQQYTNIETVRLYLEAEGSFSICFLGYSRNGIVTERKEFGIQKYYLQHRKKICFEFPKNKEQFLGFEISAIEDCVLYGGYYAAECPEELVSDICLSVCTTTCRKEAFIKRNIMLLRQEILESDGQEKENIFVHVVDNGRTLTEQDISGCHIYLHSNNNTGGSGGYARGMIESLHQDEKSVTHILLIDDDVLMLPESILRTYRLLKLLRKEYRGHFLSGAMLCYERMNIQTEDVGYVHKDGSYGPVKEELDLSFLDNVLKNEEMQYPRNNKYAGWWYCCIPREAIEKNGLPLPLFVRGDDVEFSLRNQADFITMNGLCVWHMGFAGKFSASMELYQVHRNSLIIQSTSEICQDIDFMNRLKKMFRSRLLGLDYAGAGQVLDAIEDYLQGPEFIQQDLGEKIMKRQAEKNEKLKDLSFFNQIYDYPSMPWELFMDPPRKRIHTLIYRLTYNGHRLLPHRFLSGHVDVIPYGWFYSPERFYLKKQLLAVDPFSKRGALRERDQRKYADLKKRYARLMKDYRDKGESVAKRYQEKKAYLTSEKFWRKYLALDA